LKSSANNVNITDQIQATFHHHHHHYYNYYSTFFSFLGLGAKTGDKSGDRSLDAVGEIKPPLRRNDVDDEGGGEADRKLSSDTDSNDARLSGERIGGDPEIPQSRLGRLAVGIGRGLDMATTITGATTHKKQSHQSE
jgi:hypothetical protein